MRAVLDTNVVVSALLWGGVPFDLIHAAGNNALRLFTSPASITELREVLARQYLADRLAARRSTAEDAVRLYVRLATEVRPTVVERVVAKDADDDEVIAAALAAKADIIVTGDRHLLSLLSYGGVRILTPGEAVRMLAVGPD